MDKKYLGGIISLLMIVGLAVSLLLVAWKQERQRKLSPTPVGKVQEVRYVTLDCKCLYTNGDGTVWIDCPCTTRVGSSILFIAP